MQEDLQNKSVVLTTKAAKLTGNALAKLMQAALRKMKQSRDSPKIGRQSLKQLAKGGALANVEVTDGNIKAFDPVARKYGISYDLKRDDASDPPRWLIFFRAKDMESMHAAFKEFSVKSIKNKEDRPSTRDSMQNYRGTVQNAVRDKTKNKHRGGPER